MLAHEFRNPLTAIVGAHQAAQKISSHNGDLLRPILCGPIFGRPSTSLDVRPVT